MVDSRLRPLGIAVGLVAAATVASVFLKAAFPGYSPYLFLYVPAVATAAYVGGRASGLVSVALSAVSAMVFQIPAALTGAHGGPAAGILAVFALVSAAVALAASRLRDIEGERSALLDAQHRVRAATEVVNAITTASGDDDLEHMLSSALGHLRRVIPFTGGSLVLLEGEELVCRAAVGPFAGNALGGRLPRGQGRIWQVVDTGEPFQCGDLVAAGYEPTNPLRSYLAVPLIWRGRPFGLLEVDSTAPNAFGPIDLSVMQRVASALSGTIELTKRYAAEVQAVAAAEDARRQLVFLAEAGELLASSLDHRTTVASIARLAVPTVADLCTVDMLDENGVVRTLVVAHRDPAKAEMARRLVEQHPAEARGGVESVIRTGHSALYAAIPDEMPAAGVRDAGHFRILRDLGVTSAMIAPLRTRGRTLGAITFALTESSRRYGPADLSLAEDLARRAALAMDNARAYERERHVAETLQRAFLPAGMPELPGVGLHAVYLPGAHESDVGGDWYDVFQVPDGRVALSIGDIAGRGLQAAVAMGQVRQAIRAAALENHAPALVLARASRLLELSLGSSGMATAVFGILDLGAMTFSYSIAGNPAPVLATADGRAELLASGGLPLGIDGPDPRREWTVTLPAGSLLVLYTDGLVEYDHDVIRGEAALVGAVKAEAVTRSTNPARAIQERILDGRVLRDDVAVLTVSLSPVPLDRFELTLPAEPSALIAIRQALRRLGHAVGLNEERLFALQVAVGEAVNNVIEHAYGAAGGAVRLHVRREGHAVTVDVEDHGRWRPERSQPGGRGRGIGLMQALVDSAEIQTTSSGTVARLRIEIAAPPSGTSPREMEGWT